MLQNYKMQQFRYFMIKYIIVEDEFPAREELKYYVGLYSEFSLEGEFENSIDALKFLEDKQIDVAFLDINMAGLDGVNLGKIIHKMNSNIKIVFITAYREYGADAFDIKAFDYLLKPYSEERIKKTLTNLLKEKQSLIKEDLSKVNKLVVNEGDKFIFLAFDNIYYIESSDKECLIHTINKTYTSKLKISKLEELLPSKKFFKTHRAYLVNLDKISELEAWFSGSYLIKLEDIPDKVPLSRNNIKGFKDLFIIK